MFNGYFFPAQSGIWLVTSIFEEDSVGRRALSFFWIAYLKWLNYLWICEKCKKKQNMSPKSSNPTPNTDELANVCTPFELTCFMIVVVALLRICTVVCTLPRNYSGYLNRDPQVTQKRSHGINGHGLKHACSLHDIFVLIYLTSPH